eukprot:365142-Chlamydomonas_euryale.AAC.2
MSAARRDAGSFPLNDARRLVVRGALGVRPNCLSLFYRWCSPCSPSSLPALLPACRVTKPLMAASPRGAGRRRRRVAQPRRGGARGEAAAAQPSARQEGAAGEDVNAE